MTSLKFNHLGVLPPGPEQGCGGVSWVLTENAEFWVLLRVRFVEMYRGNESFSSMGVFPPIFSFLFVLGHLSILEFWGGECKHFSEPAFSRLLFGLGQCLGLSWDVVVVEGWWGCTFHSTPRPWVAPPCLLLLSALRASWWGRHSAQGWCRALRACLCPDGLWRPQPQFCLLVFPSEGETPSPGWAG